MPLHIGNDKIKAVYVGGEKIAKAYVGADLVFSAAKPSRLPEGYTELEYIQVGPNNETFGNIQLASARADQTLTVDFTILQYPSSNSYAPNILASYATASDTLYNRDLLVLTKTGLRAAANPNSIMTSSYVNLITDLTVPRRALVVWDGPNQSISLDGGPPVPFPYYGVGTAWRIGTTVSVAGATGNSFKNAGVQIHSIVIASAGSTSKSYNKNYVPAKNSSGKYGFYDLVSDKFITHTGFEGGPVL